MSVHEIPELDARGLRQFGLMLAGVLVAVPGLLLPWMNQWQLMPNYYWFGVAAVIAIWAMLAADSMRGLYTGWMRVAMLIGHVINTLVLAIVFFLVITPMGIVMRMLGKDPMRRSLDRGVASYRVGSKVRAKDHFERPF